MLSQEEQARIRNEVRHTGRTRFPISARILDEHDTLIAELQAHWA